MSIEQNLIQVAGITLVLYFCFKTLILSTIRAYKEIYIELHQSIKEIKEKNLLDDAENEVERLVEINIKKEKRR